MAEGRLDGTTTVLSLVNRPESVRQPCIIFTSELLLMLVYS